MVGAVCVRALKTLSTPQPFDHRLATIPSAPAFSSATGSVRGSRPVFCTRAFQACTPAVRSVFIRSNEAGEPYFAQLSSGRQVGCGKETRTNLPRTLGSHALNAAESARSGRTTTGPVTGPFVPGLQ